MDYTTELWYFLIKCNKCTLTHIFLILRQLCICCQFISNPHNFHDARCANPADHAASCTTFALRNTKNIFSIKKVVQNEMVSSCFAQHTACRFHLLRYKLCKTLISILPLHNHHRQELCKNGFITFICTTLQLTSFYRLQYTSIARLTKAAVPAPAALSMFAENSASAIYIAPSPAKISSVQV